MCISSSPPCVLKLSQARTTVIKFGLEASDPYDDPLLGS